MGLFFSTTHDPMLQATISLSRATGFKREDCKHYLLQPKTVVDRVRGMRLMITEAQQITLNNHGLTLRHLAQREWNSDEHADVKAMFADWNARLGSEFFK